ncbi:iron ABC transporter permease [Limnohabitans sp. Rim8]|uniref:ABC transporter permease n=1 Tax=Limnohabitans sp. Rim8 TaxID=1100718 RepID=UPI0025EF40F5|nr:iron ABC transporter permease [Limnohabitans sp. Rim8]
MGTSAVAFTLGTTLAWINERTNTPMRRLFYTLSIVPLIIPGILFTISWIMLASPKIGLINLVMQSWFGLDSPPFNIYSMGGMIWVDGLHYSPLAFLLMSAAFRAMDPSLEESATMSGSGVLNTLYRITLKLALPAILATVLTLFIEAIASFEVPALLGLPAGIQVFTSAIYQSIHQYPSQIGLAAAYSVILLMLTTGGIYIQSRISSSGSKYSTVTGKGFRPRTIDLGKWRFFTLGIFIVYFLLIVVLPFFVLLWSSLQKFYAPPSMAALQNITLDGYRYVFASSNIRDAALNSLWMSVTTATVVMLLASVISWIVVKTKIPGRWLLDNMASLPMVFPGLVLGVSIMIFYLTFDIGIYGTFWIILLAYVTRFMPYGLRYSTTSMIQIHKDLEESAGMSGASWFTVFRRIILPLLKPGLIAGWIYVMIVSIRELSTSILLYSPGNEVISVMIWELWENGQYVELSALSVMFILMLLVLVGLAQAAGKRFGVKEG